MERRRYPRWPVALPCRVEWKDQLVEGWIANLSLGGALIRRASALPSQDEHVVLHFHAEHGNVLIEASLAARIVHRTLYGPWTAQAGEAVGDFGLEFLVPPQAVRHHLSDIFSTFLPHAVLTAG